MLRNQPQIDILLSLKGEDSYGAGCWSGLFGGFLPQPPYFSGGQRRGLTFGLSTHRSFGREDDRTNQREKNAATVTFGYIPRWLDAAALYPRPERRGFTALRGVNILSRPTRQGHLKDVGPMVGLGG